MAPESKGLAVELEPTVQGCTSRVTATTNGRPNGSVVVEVLSDRDSDCGDEEVFSRTQIKNLLWIEGSKRHKKAQEFWSAQDALCTRRVDSKRKQSLAVKNEVYQLIGFYSVFQGVLLTAVSQSNLLHCNNWWSAFSLSGLASVVALIGIIQKFLTVWSLERTIESEKESRQLYVTRGEKLLSFGESFKFHLHAKDGTIKKSRSWKLVVSIGAVIVVLVLFSDLVRRGKGFPTAMKTNIVNQTKQEFQLKEGNAGAFRLYKQLIVGANVSITVDPNATYREYMVATGKKGETIMLTSDDFSEYEVISIIEKYEGGRMVYKSLPSKPRNKGLTAAPPEASSAGTAAAGAESASSGPPEAGDPPASSGPVSPVVPPVDGGQATSSESSHADLGPKATKKAPWYKRVFK